MEQKFNLKSLIFNVKFNRFTFVLLWVEDRVVSLWFTCFSARTTKCFCFFSHMLTLFPLPFAEEDHFGCGLCCAGYHNHQHHHLTSCLRTKTHPPPTHTHPPFISAIPSCHPHITHLYSSVTKGRERRVLTRALSQMRPLPSLHC